MLYMLKLLDKEKFSCHLVGFDMGKQITEEVHALEIPIFHLPVGRYYTVNALFKAFKLRRILINNKIDIVQTFHFKSDCYGALVAYLSGIKCIISSKRDVGDIKSELQFFLNKLVRRITHRYIVVAEAVGQVVMNREKVPKNKLQVIYNGVNTDRFKPPRPDEIISARRELGFSEKDFILGMVAVMRPEKNHDILFAAFEHALANIANLKLILVGGGELLDFYQRYVNEKGIADRVLFTGLISDVRPYLRALDIACLVPGSNEGFSNSIIEKMAMGLPLIVTDVGGNAEAVRDGYNGIVIPPYKPEILAEAICKLHDNPNLQREMGKRSIKRVQDEFTLGKMIKTHEELYTSLAG